MAAKTGKRAGQEARRVALYARVSTRNGQSTENQLRELKAVGKRAGWQVVAVYQDEGISGSKGRDARPGLDAMLKAAARREFEQVAAWSVDRLGRSLTDLLGTLKELHGVGCDLYLHTQGLDTRTPAGKAMFGMMGVFAEFEREIITERIHAGIARARAQGRHLGRPRVEGPGIAKARVVLRAGGSLRDAMQASGLSMGVVRRIRAEKAARTAASTRKAPRPLPL
jgi:DNA invertase Pin-like site-specific DNA recombinase